MTPENIQFDSKNVEQQKAYDLVANTNISLFITGKAGTGKTTFVKRIQEKIDKNFLVLAPTGIAAIAVGGQTMHSFFGFPMEVMGPHTKIDMPFKSIEILEKIDTIIIDEVSMVRSDMVDAMDRCLRKEFQTNMAFGGKQVVFVGDLFQLPPVVKRGSADDDMLCDIYGKGIPFFYKAFVLKRMNLPKIEFRKIYRQSDPQFVQILNKMRNGSVSTEELDLLNQHVQATNDCEDYSVILTGYNSMADKINRKKLDAIESEEYCYSANVEGKFNVYDSPAPKELRLKVGAQVIFCRNDYTNGCVNGTIAMITALDEENVAVRLEDGREFNVGRFTWESQEKVYHRENRKIESETVGTYTQYPLKLAWAITIHKSQGMTFDRMHFDLTRGVFAPGQAYVAISRMRTLDGLTLSNPIKQHHITQNPEILAFANSFNDVDMIDDELEIGRKVYQYYSKRDFKMATQVCLDLVVDKMSHGDYRNAALIAKRMFDVMLDDQHLLGRTSDVPLLKACSTTAYFLNAVICLYGYRYEEAIGYADMVLCQRTCLEAIFVKGRALFELGRYGEAYDMCYLILSESKKSEDKKAIDMKHLLFEAKINEQIGNPNADICKKLIKLCPDYTPAYSMLRKDALKNGKNIEYEGNEIVSNLIQLFCDVTIQNDCFEKTLNKTDKNSREFILFRKCVCKNVA